MKIIESKMRKTHFLFVLLLFSFSFGSYAFADITLEGIKVNLDKVTWNFPNPITLSNFIVQDNGMTLKLDDTSEKRKYSFSRAGSSTPFDISLISFSSNKIDFTIDTAGISDVILTISGTKIDGVTLNGVVSSFTYNGIINTININSATSVSVFFFNAPQQNTGGKSGGKSTPPSLKSFGISGVQSFDSDGNLVAGGKLEKPSYQNKLLTSQAIVGKPIVINLPFSSNLGTKYNLEHVGLYTNLNGLNRSIDKSDTYIVYNVGKPIEIVDPHKFFSDVNVKVLVTNNDSNVIFEIIFAKPMEKSDLIIRSWNIEKRSSDFIFKDAIKVVESLPTISDDELAKGETSITYKETSIIPEKKTINKDLIFAWAGFKADEVSDKLILNEIGLEGDIIPKWVKKNLGKWYYQEQISESELIMAINFLNQKGLTTLKKNQ